MFVEYDWQKGKYAHTCLKLYCNIFLLRSLLLLLVPGSKFRIDFWSFQQISWLDCKRRQLFRTGHYRSEARSFSIRRFSRFARISRSRPVLIRNNRRDVFGASASTSWRHTWRSSSSFVTIFVAKIERRNLGHRTWIYNLKAWLDLGCSTAGHLTAVACFTASHLTAAHLTAAARLTAAANLAPKVTLKWDTGIHKWRHSFSTCT